MVGGNASMRPLFFNLLIQLLRPLAGLKITSAFPHLGLTWSIWGHPTKTYHFIDRTIINLSLPPPHASGKSCKWKRGRIQENQGMAQLSTVLFTFFLDFTEIRAPSHIQQNSTTTNFPHFKALSRSCLFGLQDKWGKWAPLCPPRWSAPQVGW